MDKVVVTGGAGFIGSNLAERLADMGYHVVIVDNLSTGKLENINSILHNKNVHFVQGNILDLALLNQVFREVKFVFHQAALPRVPRSITDPLSSNEANITGTLNALLAARDNHVKKFIYASSSSVYGGNPILPHREDMMPNPLSPYALTKLTGEYYCTIFRNLFGLSTACLRYFNVYGPKQDPTSQYSTVIPAFVNRIYHNQPPVIYGDGEQSREITFVQDIVQANILAAGNNAEGIYNIGGGQTITINHLAEKILLLMKSNLKPVHKEPRLGDPRFTKADISRAKSFGYEPKWTVEEGLKLTLQDCLDVLRKEEG